MTKATTAGMDTHLLSEVTTLAMAVIIERTDGVKFHLTTSSEDIKLDVGDGDGEQTYSASEGVSRSNIENDAELNVDNLDIIGIFDNVMLKEIELRRGLFDFSDFKIFVFNHQKIADGIIKIFRGQLGEVITTKQDFFQAQVRSLVQVYSKQTGEHYSKDCRADLGDIRCLVPVFPNRLKINTALTLGDFFAIPTAPENNDCAIIQMNFEGVDGATSGPGFVNQGTHTDPTLIGTPEIDTAQAPAGGTSISSMLFDGSTDGLTFADNAVLEFLALEATIQCNFRVDALGTLRTLVSKFNATSDQREWILRVTAGNVLEFVVHDDGTATPDITLTGTTTIAINTDLHVAVCRKSNGDWEMWLGGTSEAGPTTPTGDVFDSSAPLRIGVGDAGANDFFSGHIDSLEVIAGFARYEADFTPPTGNLANTNSDLALNWPAFGQRVYEVTIAGTSGVCINTPNTTLLGTHTQGTATLTAFNSWMREAIVSAVDSVEPRRKFTVTELTPISGETVNANSTPNALGFPNDWFNGGATLFETGNNAGRAIEVRDFIEGAGTQDIELITDMPFDIVIGDKLRIFPGCDKTNATCIAKFDNGINFVGEPYVPGEDIFGQYPDSRV